MFWWLYSAKKFTAEPMSKPLVIWLHGGPGAASSGYGNFVGIGPFDLNFDSRKYNWVRHANVLFVDSPVGAGFSYVKKKELLAYSDAQMALDLVELVRIFFETNADVIMPDVPVHIFGEGYSGKIAMKFAKLLQRNIKNGKIKCELKSVTSIGGWISPVYSIEQWAQFLLQTQLLDTEGKIQIVELATKLKDAVNSDNYQEITMMWHEIVTAVHNNAYGVDWCDVTEEIHTANITDELIEEYAQFTPYISRNDEALTRFMRDVVHKKMNLRNVEWKWGHWRTDVFDAAKKDFFKPVVNTGKRCLSEILLTFMHSLIAALKFQ